MTTRGQFKSLLLSFCYGKSGSGNECENTRKNIQVFQGESKRAVWEPYSGELKVVEAVVSEDEPSPLPRLNPTSWNTEKADNEDHCVHSCLLCCQLSVETGKPLKAVQTDQNADVWVI